MQSIRRILIIIAVAVFASMPVRAAEAHSPVLVAVATNFSQIAEELARVFEERTGVPITIASGSTGHIYAQVVNGAPYHIFLAADQTRPQKLEEAGIGLKRFVYARGYIGFWFPNNAASEAALQESSFNHLAIANPALAPYGLAAQEALTALGVWAQLQDKIVMGQNVGQTHALIASGNAEAGIIDNGQRREKGEFWLVPPELYRPILQEAVLLSDDPAAVVFFDFLASSDAQAMIKQAGYGVPNDG